MEPQIDFLAIGDVVVDAFIKLKDAEVHCKIDNTECEICMRWGDKIPYESATIVPGVGNSANAAVAAARLGLRSALRAYVGDDMYAGQCYDAFNADKVDTTYIEKVPGKHTNYHYVLWYAGQRTILVKHETFEYKAPTMPVGPKWLYLSSLGENSLPYHHELMEMLKQWPNTKLAFQPGTYQMQFGTEALKEVYERTDLLVCNKEEAERILKLPAGSEIKTLLSDMQKLGPKIVIITDDIRGSYALDESGQAWHIPRYPDPRPPFEITGAGDALASTTVVALALGLSFEEALVWGPVNASAVLQEIGAQKGLLTREGLEHDLKNPPGPYAATKI